jgi:hypothetical protein
VTPTRAAASDCGCAGLGMRRPGERSPCKSRHGLFVTLRDSVESKPFSSTHKIAALALIVGALAHPRVDRAQDPRLGLFRGALIQPLRKVTRFLR